MGEELDVDRVQETSDDEDAGVDADDAGGRALEAVLACEGRDCAREGSQYGLLNSISTSTCRGEGEGRTQVGLTEGDARRDGDLAEEVEPGSRVGGERAVLGPSEECRPVHRPSCRGDGRHDLGHRGGDEPARPRGSV